MRGSGKAHRTSLRHSQTFESSSKREPSRRTICGEKVSVWKTRDSCVSIFVREPPSRRSAKSWSSLAETWKQFPTLIFSNSCAPSWLGGDRLSGSGKWRLGASGTIWEKILCSEGQNWRQNRYILPTVERPKN